MKKEIWYVILLAFILASCNTNPATSPEQAFTLAPTNVITDPLATQTPLPGYYPQPGDNALTRGRIVPTSINLLRLETDPPQIQLLLSGYLPTPCHELRVVIQPPNENNDILVEIYSLVNPDLECEQVLRAFDETIVLGNYPSGSYWVWVNGGKVGNFDF